MYLSRHSVPTTLCSCQVGVQVYDPRRKHFLIISRQPFIRSTETKCVFQLSVRQLVINVLLSMTCNLTFVFYVSNRCSDKIRQGQMTAGNAIG